MNYKIRTLHLPGLIGPTSSSTRASLYAKFYELSRLLLEDEVTHLYPAATDPSFWNSKAEIDPAYYVFLGDSTMRNVEKYIWKALVRVVLSVWQAEALNSPALPTKCSVYSFSFQTYHRRFGFCSDCMPLTLAIRAMLPLKQYPLGPWNRILPTISYPE